jgi:hypothetical protein
MAKRGYDQLVSEESPAQRSFVSISNLFNRPMGLTIEPWGDQFVMAPGDSVRLDMLGPEGGGPEVVIEPDGVTVFAWEGSTFSGWLGKEHVLHGETEFPAGMTVMRRFGLFGQQHRSGGDT